MDFKLIIKEINYKQLFKPPTKIGRAMVEELKEKHPSLNNVPYEYIPEFIETPHSCELQITLPESTAEKIEHFNEQNEVVVKVASGSLDSYLEIRVYKNYAELPLKEQILNKFRSVNRIVIPDLNIRFVYVLTDDAYATMIVDWVHDGCPLYWHCSKEDEKRDSEYDERRNQWSEADSLADRAMSIARSADTCARWEWDSEAYWPPSSEAIIYNESFGDYHGKLEIFKTTANGRNFFMVEIPPHINSGFAHSMMLDLKNIQDKFRKS